MTEEPRRLGGTPPPARRTVGVGADEVAATTALTLVGLAAVIGMCRVFPDWAFLRPMVTVVVVVHLVSLVLRAMRVPAVVAVLLTLVVAAEVLALEFYRDTVRLGLPSAETLDLVRVDLRLVWAQFPTAVAPVPSTGTYLVAATIAVAVMAVLADVFAFRVDGRAESVMPSGVVFVFTAALGTDRNRVAVTALWLACAVLAIAALRVLHLGADASWLGRRRGRLRASMPAALGCALVGALVAAAAGPNLPGADSDALLDTRRREGEVTEVLSPLVDIRSRLVNRTNTEMFTVEASAGRYWRVTGLSEFDGTTWGLPDSDLLTADGILNAPRSGAPLLQQRVRISRLGGNLVPAAFTPVSVDLGDAAWLPGTDTIVLGGEGLESGDEFVIASDVGAPDPAVLRAATASSPPDPIFLDLPGSFPSDVVELARQVTAGAATPYDQALALQNWFRSEFEYDLTVQRGHGNDAIQAFLRIRRGYCEQFAGTFAAMARSIGLPARVAVGFTEGELRSDGRWHVLGRNAHAWPEVWFDGIGWVLFEPTPSRGAPGQEAHTGVAPQQDTGTGTVDGIEEVPDTAVTTTVPTESTTATTVPGAPATSVPAAAPSGGSGDRDRDGGGGGPGLVGWIVLGLAAVGLWAWLMPKTVRRLTRTGRDPNEQVLDAWHATVDSLVLAGAPELEGRTPLEFADVIDHELPVDGRSLHELARYATRAVYSPAGVGEPAALRAAVLRTHLDESTLALTPWWSRVTLHLDPRAARRRIVGERRRRR